MRRRRPLRLLLIGVLVTGALMRGGHTAPDDGEPVPYERRLPGEARAEIDATVVVDARTGRPIEGARVSAHPEDTGPTATRYDVVLAEQRTDALGVAHLASAEGQHFLVRAPGYATFHTFAVLPARVALRRGFQATVRFHDAWDRPVPGATVDVYPGAACPHAPTIERHTAGEDGQVLLRDLDGEGVNLWVSAPGFATVRTHVVPASLGGRTRAIELTPSPTIRGRILDRDGKPLVGAVVRDSGYPRGPLTPVGPDGRFALEGHDLGEDVALAHPTFAVDRPESDDVDPRWRVDAVAADVPLDLVWTADGFGGPRPTRTVTLRVGAAPPVSSVPLRVVVFGPDGRGAYATLARTEVDGPTEAQLTLGRGTYRVRGAEPFAATEVVERTFTITNEDATVELATRPAARLGWKDLPPGTTSLRIVGGAAATFIPLPPGKPAPEVHVPTEGPLAVVAFARGTRRLAAEAGAAQGGVRTAAFAPGGFARSREVRIRVRGTETSEAWAEVEGGGRGTLEMVETDEETPEGEALLVTEALGPVIVACRAGEEERAVRVALPPDEARPTEIVVDLSKPEGRLPRGSAMLTVVAADGEPLPEMRSREPRAQVTFDPQDSEPLEVDVPRLVELSGAGLQTTCVDVTEPGPRKLVVPAGRLELTIVDAEGHPVDGVALVDGTLHAFEEGHLVVRGIPAGPHAVVVSPDVGRGVLWRYASLEGERRTKRIALPAFR